MGIKKACHQGNVGTASRDHSKQVSVVVLRAFQELVWTEALQAAAAQQSYLSQGAPNHNGSFQCALNPDSVLQRTIKSGAGQNFGNCSTRSGKSPSFHPLDRSRPLCLSVTLLGGRAHILIKDDPSDNLPPSTHRPTRP